MNVWYIEYRFPARPAVVESGLRADRLARADFPELGIIRRPSSGRTRGTRVFGYLDSVHHGGNWGVYHFQGVMAWACCMQRSHFY